VRHASTRRGTNLTPDGEHRAVARTHAIGRQRLNLRTIPIDPWRRMRWRQLRPYIPLIMLSVAVAAVALLTLAPYLVG
jgi:hypothetical protein